MRKLEDLYYITMHVSTSLKYKKKLLLLGFYHFHPASSSKVFPTRQLTYFNVKECVSLVFYYNICRWNTYIYVPSFEQLVKCDYMGWFYKNITSWWWEIPFFFFFLTLQGSLCTVTVQAIIRSLSLRSRWDHCFSLITIDLNSSNKFI